MPLATGVGSAHEGVENIHRDGEDDGAVVLRRDAVQGLEVAELQSSRIVHDHLRCVSLVRRLTLGFLELFNFTSKLGWPCVLPRQRSPSLERYEQPQPQQPWLSSTARGP